MNFLLCQSSSHLRLFIVFGLLSLLFIAPVFGSSEETPHASSLTVGLTSSGTLACGQLGVTLSATALNVEGQSSYLFTGPNDFSAINTTGLLSVSAPGTYSVVVTNAICSCSASAMATVSSLLHPDYLPLVDLYNATNGLGWANKTGWLTNCDPCSGWYGVTCGGGGRVNTIDLSSNALTGEIPQSIGKCTQLLELFLTNNRLSGKIPESIGNLAEVYQIFLNGNKLSGSIPASFSKLKQLFRLWLQDNQLTGSIPEEIGNLQGIKYLELFNNQLSGQIPENLGNLRGLKSINLHNNLLVGSIPSSLGNLRQLDGLTLSQNQLSGCIPPSLSVLCGKEVSLYFNPELPGGGDWSSFCMNGLGSCRQCNLVISSQSPSSTIIYERGIVTFIVSATSTEPISYQWYKDGVKLSNSNTISGINSATLVITDAQKVNSGNYYIVIKNACNSIASKAFNLEVEMPTHLDYAALSVLFYNTKGLSWTNRSNWLTSCDPCNGWFGVTCSNGRVTDVQLPNNNLKGELPAQLSQLTQIQKLNLKNNQLSGCIPISLTALCSKQVDISNNPELAEGGNWSIFCQYGIGACGGCDALITIQPPSFSAVCARSIVTISASVTSAQPLAYQWYKDGIALTNGLKLTGVTTATLTVLDVQAGSVGNYYAIITSTCNALTTSTFNLAITTVVHPDFEALADLFYSSDGMNWNKKINWLINCDPCSGWYGISCSNNRVIKIELQNNNLRGVISNKLSDLSELAILEMSDNSIRGTIPSSLSVLQKLTKLSLGHNLLSGQIPEELGFIRSLSYIYLRTNFLTGSIPNSFSNLINLGELYLDNNKLSGELPSGLGKLKKLGSIWLDYNSISGVIPDSFGELSGLSALVINHNRLEGSIPSTFSKLNNLQALYLRGNLLTGVIPKGLGDLNSIQQIDLSSNRLTGAIPEELGKLMNLTMLSLYGNELSGAIPAILGNLNKLRELYLSFNNLSDVIPNNFNNLYSIQKLDLSYNKITGPIPSFFSKFSSLKLLGLSNNLFSGCIPISLTSLCGKEVYIGGNPNLPYGGDWVSFCATGKGSSLQLATLKDGSWHDRSIWSCGSVPSSQDSPIIKHAVSISPGQAAQAFWVRYEQQGKLLFGIGSKLQLGQ